MPNYDKEVVISMLQGEDNDYVVRDAVKHLKEKHVKPDDLIHFYESEVVEHNSANLIFKLGVSKEAIKALTDKSRLYIVGHGTLTYKKVGGLTGKEMADTLVNDAEMSKIKRISVVACYGGGNSKDLLDFENSFSENLLRELKKLKKDPVDITARAGLVRVGSDGKKTVDGLNKEKDKVVILTIDDNGKINKSSKY